MLLMKTWGCVHRGVSITYATIVGKADAKACTSIARLLPSAADAPEACSIISLHIKRLMHLTSAPRSREMCLCDDGAAGRPREDLDLAWGVCYNVLWLRVPLFLAEPDHLQQGKVYSFVVMARWL